MTIPQFFIKRSQIDDNGYATLGGPDARHMRLVLRVKKGDRIRLVDEERNLHEAAIEKVADREVVAQIVRTEQGGPAAGARLTVVQGIPRLPKADLIVQKLTELGVGGIVFAPTGRTPYRDGHKRLEARLERLHTIAGAAARQCSRRDIPEVAVRADLGEAVEALGADAVMLVADEGAGGKRLKDCLSGADPRAPVAVFIGPEGGLSEDETRMLEKAGAKPFSLGRNILRTETAAIVATALILYELGEI